MFFENIYVTPKTPLNRATFIEDNMPYYYGSPGHEKDQKQIGGSTAGFYLNGELNKGILDRLSPS